MISWQVDPMREVIAVAAAVSWWIVDEKGSLGS